MDPDPVGTETIAPLDEHPGAALTVSDGSVLSLRYTMGACLETGDDEVDVSVVVDVSHCQATAGAGPTQA